MIGLLCSSSLRDLVKGAASFVMSTLQQSSWESSATRKVGKHVLWRAEQLPVLDSYWGAMP